MKNKESISAFFDSYLGIEESMENMNKAELDEYLENDIFIMVASAASGIPENDFRDYAPIYFNCNS